jgi:dTDP-4-amino-4,6-dideoxygalactose transaminase
MSRPQYLPFALPDIGQAELREVTEVLQSGWLTTGPKAHQFEREFAEYVGARFAIAVNSCTAAMHLALEAAGLRSGDFVITTPYTFAATAEVIRYFDAVPVFVDVDPRTLNMDPEQLETVLADLRRVLDTGAGPETVSVRRALSGAAPTAAGQRPAVRAVIPVHMAGQPCDMTAIARVARTNSLALIEDAAHACSSAADGRRVGAAVATDVDSIACFSFYATKTLATGEGGMVTTDNPVRAERIRLMSLHGISKDAWKRYTADGHWFYEIVAPGFKYNMPDLVAAVGLAQLRKVEQMRLRREEIARQYSEAFSALPELEVPSVRGGITHAWHLYMLRLNDDALAIDRDAFVTALKQRNIGTSVHFIPLHIHPYYREGWGYQPGDFPIAMREYRREISLPIYSKMSDADVQDVIDAVTSLARSHSAVSDRAIAGR